MQISEVVVVVAVVVVAKMALFFLCNGLIENAEAK